jgi:hypothetical protein
MSLDRKPSAPNRPIEAGKRLVVDLAGVAAIDVHRSPGRVDFAAGTSPPSDTAAQPPRANHDDRPLLPEGLAGVFVAPEPSAGAQRATMPDTPPIRSNLVASRRQAKPIVHNRGHHHALI